MAADALRVLRKRSLEDYDDDYKPLSKRMHSMYLLDAPVTGDLLNDNIHGDASTSLFNSQHSVAVNYNNLEAQHNNSNENQEQLQYDPDLSSDQNPYYYESNKLLFDLYVERLHRQGQN
ncbi:uncharacterized protein LOC126840471 isoform X2 [Adelges cooleyi]|uniref:uncharacterized protein LOC126840471 isoform X2 n=1 Tax=Adelges cooleyi TaxID=133065 RepID=UPI00217F4397|nr:uncharacterized protein LOC126840471 isoform X2 [Adelges cooleyi]